MSWFGNFYSKYLPILGLFQGLPSQLVWFLPRYIYIYIWVVFCTGVTDKTWFMVGTSPTCNNNGLVVFCTGVTDKTRFMVGTSPTPNNNVWCWFSVQVWLMPARQGLWTTAQRLCARQAPRTHWLSRRETPLTTWQPTVPTSPSIFSRSEWRRWVLI